MLHRIRPPGRRQRSQQLRQPHYLPVNPPIEPPKPGNPNIADLDRWQPIALVQYVDQAGNVYNSNPPALSPEWGAVLPFALTEATDDVLPRRLRLQRLPRPRRAAARAGRERGHLQMGLRARRGLVGSSRPGGRRDDGHLAGEQRQHRRAAEDVRGSPGVLRPAERRQPEDRHDLNPATGAPYEPQIVPRGDYTRVSPSSGPTAPLRKRRPATGSRSSTR